MRLPSSRMENGRQRQRLFENSKEVDAMKYEEPEAPPSYIVERRHRE